MIAQNEIPNKRFGEEVVIHLWRHWFIFFKIFLMFLGLNLILPAVYFLLITVWPQIMANDIIQPIIAVFVLSYYLIMLVFLLTTWTEVYLDVWTITTERIINREQNGLFNRVVSEMDLGVIQDVTAEQKGLFATLLHYGDVHVQTAGTQERFVFEQIPDPYKIAKMIQKLNEQARKDTDKKFRL